MQRNNNAKIHVIIILIAAALMIGCQTEPQKVRRMSEKNTPDSAVMAQLKFNMQMASAADNACITLVQADSLQYAADDFGFWYTKTINLYADSLTRGEMVALHLQMMELDGTLLADVKDHFTVGTSDLPLVVNRCLKQMSRGEEMRIIAPWYTAYGAEGTALIKPYTNLIIVLKIEE